MYVCMYIYIYIPVACCLPPPCSRADEGPTAQTLPESETPLGGCGAGVANVRVWTRVWVRELCGNNTRLTMWCSIALE